MTNLEKKTNQHVEALKLYWSLLPKEIKTTAQELIKELEITVSPTEISLTLLPAEWQQSTAIMEAIKIYLKSQKIKGINFNIEQVKAIISTVHNKTKDDIPFAVEVFNFNTQRGYTSIFFPNNQQAVQPIINEVLQPMPNADEIKFILRTHYKNQTIHENVIKQLIEFNLYLKETKSFYFNQKTLNDWLKSASKINDASSSVYTLINYCKYANTLQLPSSWEVIVSFVKEKNNVSNIDQNFNNRKENRNDKTNSIANIIQQNFKT